MSFRTVTAAVLAAAAGYLAGGYLGLPGYLQETEATETTVADAVNERFKGFATSCEKEDAVTYDCGVNKRGEVDGSTLVSVTVNRDGCWEAQRYARVGIPGIPRSTAPVERGCL